MSPEGGIEPSTALLALATCRLGPSVWKLADTGSDTDSRTGTDDVATFLGGFGFEVAVADLSGASDKAAVLEAILAAVDAPEWAGRNWDALLDVLVEHFATDETAALLLTGGAGLVTSDPSTVRTLDEVLADAAAEHQSRGRVFYAVWVGAGPDDVAAVEDVV